MNAKALSATARLPSVLLLAAIIAVLVYAFRDGLAWAATESWDTDEYNHCYLLPFISLFLIATRMNDLAAVPWAGSWHGVVVIAAGFLLLLLGNLSAVFTISQYGFVVAVWGACLAVLGWPVVRIIWPALVYLLFIVPLPDFLQVKLTADMQLISSQLGVEVIRLAGIPVYLEGNVIDLGQFQLAVAEACSGLRYLFPLMSFGFLCAVLYQAPLWQRTVVFLTTVPITILMNSFRIGVIGVLVNRWGTEQAEGFMHDFEGWIVFMACVAILFGEMYVLARLSGRNLLRSLRMGTPPLAEIVALVAGRPVHHMAALGAVAVLAGTLGAAALENRGELVPKHGQLATFPLVMGEWWGTEGETDPRQLAAVKADETFLGTYARGGDAMPVWVWIAYYGSQREGRSVHSPKTCLPGGGWQMESFDEVRLDGVRSNGAALPVNRAVIAQGGDRQLVFYWFVQRGRVLTSEYLVKWYIFWDGLRMNRTDGALVRLVTMVDPSDGTMEGADRRLREFVQALDPKLDYFLPQKDAVLLQARAD
jgi:exosortase D (VPLPA-CTERM-specific)